MKTSAEYMRDWRKRNPQKAKEKSREYSKKFREKRSKEEYNLYMKKYRNSGIEKARAYANEKYRNATEQDHEKRRARNRALVSRRKTEGLIQYGGNPPKCACCGEKTIEFLSLDHINGGGYQHRKKTKTNLWLVLSRQGWPDGYRILCFNCNMCLGFNGYCPHNMKMV